MSKPLLIFESSPLYLLLCLIVSVGLAYLLYRGKYPWSQRTNRLLFAARVLLLFIVTALLLSPILKYLTNEIENPTVVVAVDNSSSISEVVDSAILLDFGNKINSLGEILTENGYTPQIVLLDGQSVSQAQDINFEYKNSNLTSLLNEVQNKYEGRNLHSVILASDGIYNSGVSPTFSNYGFQLSTIGIGDTLSKKDVSIQNIRNNRVAYQGNNFPVQVSVLNEGFDSQEVSLTLSKGSEVIETRTISFGSDGEVIREDFELEATEMGTQRYNVRVSAIEGEFTLANNAQTFFIDVVEGKEKILLLAEQPHPDIRAIKESIESNPNYEFISYVRGVSKQAPEGSDYDLVICHQCTGTEGFISSLNQLNISETPLLIHYGRQLSISNLNQNSIVQVANQVPGEFDNVTSVFNTGFSSFELSQDLRVLMEEFPPLLVPFGEFVSDFETESLLFQRVGSVETAKPLVVVQTAEPRQAVILGEGIWRWRLHDYLRNDSHANFNEFITKLVQFLSTKEDRQKLKVYPISNLTTDQSVVLETEVYNSLYEKIVGVPINLQVTDESGNVNEYNYAVSEANSRYTIDGLTTGVYTYRASASVGNESYSTRGQFVIKELQLEYLNLTADFNVLRTLSEKNGGTYTHFSSMESLYDSYSPENAKGIIHSFESYNPLVNLAWILVALILLVSIEWFTRKYFGAY